MYKLHFYTFVHVFASGGNPQEFSMWFCVKILIERWRDFNLHGGPKIVGVV